MSTFRYCSLQTPAKNTVLCERLKRILFFADARKSLNFSMNHILRWEPICSIRVTIGEEASASRSQRSMNKYLGAEKMKLQLLARITDEQLLQKCIHELGTILYTVNNQGVIDQVAYFSGSRIVVLKAPKGVSEQLAQRVKAENLSHEPKSRISICIWYLLGFAPIM